jgi:predicted Fe-Mo cluster-binding NifX family protein
MKIAVTATGTDLDSAVDPRFGRAPYILIVDSETMAVEALDNQENMNAFKGAGIQAASLISNHGAGVLLTGHCGPNAFKALRAANIGVANNAAGTVRQAVEAYAAGKFPLADESDVEANW